MWNVSFYYLVQGCSHPRNRKVMFSVQQYTPTRAGACWGGSVAILFAHLLSCEAVNFIRGTGTDQLGSTLCEKWLESEIRRRPSCFLQEIALLGDTRPIRCNLIIKAISAGATSVAETQWLETEPKAPRGPEHKPQTGDFQLGPTGRLEGHTFQGLVTWTG